MPNMNAKQEISPVITHICMGGEEIEHEDSWWPQTYQNNKLPSCNKAD